MDEFNKTAAVVATNIQKLVQNVSSMQRMLVHVETQGQGLRTQLRQLQHYTGQLAKDTAAQLKLLVDSHVTDSAAKLQRERLKDEFTKAVTNFQRVQREAAEKERTELAAAKVTGREWELAGPKEAEQGTAGQSRTQLMVEEEERIGALQQREQGMRQLESDIVDVNTIFKVGSKQIHCWVQNKSNLRCLGPGDDGARAGGDRRQHRAEHRGHHSAGVWLHPYTPGGPASQMHPLHIFDTDALATPNPER